MIVLGKSFAGKSTTLKRYGQGKVKMATNFGIYNCFYFVLENGVTIINIEQLFHEAIDAFNNNEINDEEVSVYPYIINN